MEEKCRFFRPRQCFLNGCCSCDSKESVDFQFKLSRYLRSVFCKRDGVAPKERLLLDRRLFLAFHSQDVRSSAATANKAEIFMHLAYVNLTSWRFTGLKLHPVRWSEDGCVTLQIIADSSSAADASLQVQTDMELCLRSLNLSTGCEVSAYILSDKPSHWEPQQGVNLVPVVVLPDFSFQWMNDDGLGPSRGGGRGKKRQRNDEDMDDLELAQRLLDPGPRAAQTKSAPKRGASDQAAGEQPPEDDDPLDRASVAASEALDSQGSAASALSWLEELDKASESASDASSTDDSDVIAELLPAEGAKEAGAPVDAREAGEAVPPDATANQAGEAAATGEAVAAARRSAAFRDRTGTETLRIGSLGEVRFLPQSSQFVAVCEHPAHGDCRRTRTAIGSSDDKLNTPMQRDRSACSSLGCRRKMLMIRSSPTAMGSQQASRCADQPEITCSRFLEALISPSVLSALADRMSRQNQEASGSPRFECFPQNQKLARHQHGIPTSQQGTVAHEMGNQPVLQLPEVVAGTL